MQNICTNGSKNIFYNARIRAAQYNPRLSNRENASQETGIDRTRLARIEAGIVQPNTEDILMMAGAYNAPELKPLYCNQMCPLGENLPDFCSDNLDRITIRAMCSMRKIKSVKSDLLEITEDGTITEGEKPELRRIIKELDELTAITQSLKVWAEKHGI